MAKQTNIALFASGTGSNAKKIIEYFQEHPSIHCSLLLSNKKSAPALAMAASKGLETKVISRDYFYKEESILDLFQEHKIDWIILAGFLWLVPTYLVAAFPNRIVNIHPALLPRYGGKGMYGMHVHKAVRANDEQESGITIHYVNAKYDEGAIIFQASCRVDTEDSPTDIAKKVQQLEHAHFAPQIEKLML